MNNDVIRQSNDIMVCSFNLSIFVKEVKYLYSTILGKVEQTVKQWGTTIIILSNETSKFHLTGFWVLWNTNLLQRYSTNKEMFHSVWLAQVPWIVSGDQCQGAKMEGNPFLLFLQGLYKIQPMGIESGENQKIWCRDT